MCVGRAGVAVTETETAPASLFEGTVDGAVLGFPTVDSICWACKGRGFGPDVVACLDESIVGAFGAAAGAGTGCDGFPMVAYGAVVVDAVAAFAAANDVDDKGPGGFALGIGCVAVCLLQSEIVGLGSVTFKFDVFNALLV